MDKGCKNFSLLRATCEQLLYFFDYQASVFLIPLIQFENEILSLDMLPSSCTAFSDYAILIMPLR